MDWKHKDEWKVSGENFTIVVSRHAGSADCGDGPNRWCVYAYIYPKHPYFSKFDGPFMYQDAANAMPLHGGPTFFKYQMHGEKISSVKVGCDYNHYQDTHFTHYATTEEAYQVFEDAEDLYNWLYGIENNEQHNRDTNQSQSTDC